MAVYGRWGLSDFQRRFYERQVHYRNTLDRLMSEEGAKVISENSMALRLTNHVKNLEDLSNLVLCRVLAPLFREGRLITPQIIGIDRKGQNCYIFFYLPILKAFSGKVQGLVDVMTAILGNKGCDLIAFLTAGRGGSMGQIAVISAYDVREKETLRRAFSKQEGGVIAEFSMPLEHFEDVFCRTFDQDIWTSDEVWKEPESGKS
jgi:hypothetical protein